MKKLKAILFSIISFLTTSNVGTAMIKHENINIETTPDQPELLGTRYWIAIKGNYPQKVIENLPLKNIQVANWKSGLNKVYHSNNLVFITPEINGWILVGGDIPPLELYEQEYFNKFFSRLIKAFNDIQYFGDDKNVGYIGWAKANNGIWVRQFAFYDGHLLATGKQTIEEKRLSIKDIRNEEELDQSDNFEHIASLSYDIVYDLATKWSINPEKLNQLPNLKPSTGWIGEISNINQGD